MSDAWDNTDVRDATPEEETMISTVLAQRKQIEELEAKLAKAVRLMELSVELATWNTTLFEDVIDFIAELKGQDDEL